MSYILEALRRADAERQRGQVPGLNAQPAGARAEAPPRRWPAFAAAAAVGAVALAGVVWFTGERSRDAPPVPGAPVAAAPAAPRLVVLAPTAPPLAAPPPSVASTGMAPPQGSSPSDALANVPIVAPPATAPTAAAPPKPSPPPLPRVVSAPPRPAPAFDAPTAVGTGPRPGSADPVMTAPPRPSPATPPSATAAAPLPLAQLPPAQRRELPPMTVGGSIWSDHAASRFVLINGQVVREGETAAPGVVVERIEPKAAVLRWRDLRLQLPL